MLDVNDTLVVSRSVDPVFERGDRILAINDVPVSEYLQYCYDDRYIYPFILLKTTTTRSSPLPIIKSGWNATGRCRR